MSGGGKVIIVNTQERAISPDINRLQRFANCDRAEILRYTQSVYQGSDDSEAGASGVDILTNNSPLSAEVQSGLLVLPVNGTLNLLVSDGAMLAVAPLADGSEIPFGDDSVYKVVRDYGVTRLGALAMTANTSGSTRVDVIECAVLDANIEESDNRDVFNPVTGLFTAQTITKAVRDVLVYRVRTGTPGLGFPGTAQGWLPLAVAWVPNGAMTNDTITFWDVRPLVSNRVFAPASLSRVYPHVRTRGHNQLTGGTSKLYAQTEATSSDGILNSYGLYRLGGELRSGSPGVTTLYPFLDLNDLNNQDGVAHPGTGTWLYLYLLEPFGLPRWARYSPDATRVRAPMSPRGIPILSSTPPNTYGVPDAAVPIPFFNTTCSKGVCVYVTRTDGSAAASAIMDERSATYFGSDSDQLLTGVAVAAPLDVLWTLAAGIDFPSNARALRLSVLLHYNITAVPKEVQGAQWRFTLQDGAGNDIAYLGRLASPGTYATSSRSLVLSGVLHVPIPAGAPNVFLLGHYVTSTLNTPDSVDTINSGLTLSGWDL